MLSMQGDMLPRLLWAAEEARLALTEASRSDTLTFCDLVQAQVPQDSAVAVSFGEVQSDW